MAHKVIADQLFRKLIKNKIYLWNESYECFPNLNKSLGTIEVFTAKV